MLLLVHAACSGPTTAGREGAGNGAGVVSLPGWASSADALPAFELAGVDSSLSGLPSSIAAGVGGSWLAPPTAAGVGSALSAPSFSRATGGEVPRRSRHLPVRRRQAVTDSAAVHR